MRELSVGQLGSRSLVWEPKDIAGPLPAILFLHGRGESGADLESLANHGLLKAAQEQPELWPFLIIAPQKLDPNQLWPAYRYLVDETLAEVERRYDIHPTQRYLTGLSQGGNGTFELARHLSWRFAAIAPICGWCDPIKAKFELRDTPIWAFHGLDDTVILPSASRVAVEFICQGGGDARLTEYPDVGHHSWELAYADPELPRWFLSHPAPGKSV
ncbi:MAG: hypothetical protein IT363_05575 [Methanoregulaceae archaeon]|nr:hypothetical protein [Methanoregulaceae archaeon]